MKSFLLTEQKFLPLLFFLWLKIMTLERKFSSFSLWVSHMNLCSPIAKHHLEAKLVYLISTLEATWTFLHYVAAKHIGISARRFQILTYSSQRSISTIICKIIPSH